MKLEDLDEGRLQYIWSDWAENNYQILQRLDEFEWRAYHSAWPEGKIDNHIFRCGGSLYFLTYVSGVPTKYDTTSAFFGCGVVSGIIVDINSRLRRIYDASLMRLLTSEQFHKFEDSRSWEEVDGII
jgi:hypothetical protein